MPILLSVGYAACHWCHVMAHESFEDDATAAVMNKLFVNVKVDREERPDVDTIYMSALHVMGEQGGWPLTMFLTPEGKPFWGGTYFPPQSRYGRPGFTDVLHGLSDAWKNKRNEVTQNVTALVDGLKKREASSPGGPDQTPALLDRIAKHLAGAFDMTHGGLRGAPKFPQSSILELIWRAWVRGGTQGPLTTPAAAERRHRVGFDRHEPGRHLRSSRRRLRPLFDRRTLAGAAFREDALRQRRADRCADPGVAGHQEPALRGACVAEIGRRWLEPPR